MIKKLIPISPIFLVVIVWTITVVVAVLPFGFPETFDIAVSLIERQQGLDTRYFGWLGASWLIVAFLLFVVASLITTASLPKPKPFNTDLDLDRGARAAITTNLFFLSITFAWVLVTALQLGGFRAMILLVQLDAIEAREQLLGNKLFTGMRVIYASLPATGCMCILISVAGSITGNLSPTLKKICTISFAMNVLVLLVLPIVMSQRLLLVQLIMSSYFATCMMHRRLIGIHYIPIGIGLFLTTWILRESLSNPTIAAGAIEIGLEKLVFYFTNDLMNAFIPFNYEFDHTLGYFSFKFVRFFTFTDQFFADVLFERIEAVKPLRGGGEWSIFTMPYVDFGAYGAALYIAALAVVSAIVFHKGGQDMTWAAIYGQFAGGFVLCTHNLYFADTNFAAMVMVCAFVGSFAKPKRQEAARGRDTTSTPAE